MFFKYDCAILATSALLGMANGKIVNMNVESKSLQQHHTDFFNMQDGFVVRRGQEFNILIDTDDEQLGNGAHELKFYNHGAKDYNSALFEVVGGVQAGENVNQFRARIRTSATAPVGKYEDITLSVDGSDFRYEAPLYLIFNPWAKEDSQVYLPTEEMRQEYVLQEYGNVYQGSVGDYASNKWHYGQSNQITLDAIFHLLRKLDRKHAGDAIQVVQAISQGQGMMRKKTGGILVGSEDSLLEGNWGDFPFNDTNSPEIWTSSTDILKTWNATGKPVQYGQCWVFAALLNAMMRAVGVGSQQLTGFGAVVDMSAFVDKHHKEHHVCDSYFLEDGTDVTFKITPKHFPTGTAGGRPWNFHSWINIWMNRPEYEALGGWQSVDGTPPGNIGPASLNAVRTLDESHPYNVSSIISTVHSTTRAFLVECPEKDSKFEHCKVKDETPLKYDHTGLPLLVSSKTTENGTMVEDNITSKFIDPATDARIPFEKKRRMLRAKAMKASPLANAASIVPATYSITVGDVITGNITIDTEHLVQGEMVDLNIKYTMENYMGKEIKTLKSVSERMLVKGSQIIVPWTLDNSAYLEKDLGDVYVRIVAIGKTEKGGRFLAQDVFDIDAPEVSIQMAETVQVGQGAALPVEATFTNPLEFSLDNVCITLHSQKLDFADKPLDVTSHRECFNLTAKETVVLKTALVPPTKADVYYVVATVSGDYLPVSSSHVDVTAVEGPSNDPTSAPTSEEVDEVELWYPTNFFFASKIRLY